jgi:sortase A
MALERYFSGREKVARVVNANAIPGQHLHRRKQLILLERLTGLLGLMLLAIYCSAQLYAFVLSRAAMYAINSSLAAAAPSLPEGDKSEIQKQADYKLWAKARLQAYRAVAHLKLDAPIAVLSIPRLRLTAPVFDGTGSTVMNRGLGRIAGTAALGTSGNLAIAGHRDGFFRVLKDIEPGDLIQIRTRRGEDIYAVVSRSVVNRRDTSVLQPTAFSVLTLVTCYPFYFVGDAPDRFIVKAVLRQTFPRATPHSADMGANGDPKAYGQASSHGR